MSTGHLHLLYKQKFGLSCMDDVIASRIRKAKDLLIYTDHSIVEICEQCGYQNLEHFCRQFHKNTYSHLSENTKSRAPIRTGRPALFV